MIFSPEAICLPVQTATWHNNTGGTLGKQNTLCIVAAQAGHGTLMQAEHTLPLAQGQYGLAPGPIALVPVESFCAQGVALVGSAPLQLAGNLSAPLLVEGAACPGAADIMNRLVTHGDDMPPCRASALGYELICALAQARTGAPQLPALVADAVAQIHQHYTEVYGVEELAEALGVSKSHLVRSFGASLGISPGKYLTAVRLDAAKKMLLHRSHPLDLIASMCGFSGANYFCKVFKKETGTTPAAWRRQNTPHGPLPPALQALEDRMYL